MLHDMVVIAPGDNVQMNMQCFEAFMHKVSATVARQYLRKSLSQPTSDEEYMLGQLWQVVYRYDVLIGNDERMPRILGIKCH